MTTDVTANLNPQQRQAVTAGLGQILVLAGPGSGKTRVLTQRIAYLIQNMGVRPYNILSVTFTNKAAREMTHRLENTLGGPARDLWLGTFHAVCARILRREAERLPFTSDFVIMDADDQEKLVKRALHDLNLDEKLYKPANLHNAISTAKNDLVPPEDFSATNYREEVTRRVYKRYEELLRASNAVDFDDLLLWAVKLLVNEPQVRERYARRFEHVLVDEFQDTNKAQYELLKLLSGYHANIFVVGDEDQSIYRWRGADYRNVLRFEQDFPRCQKILLEQNYRSTQNVLDAARAVIDQNNHRTPKRLFTERSGGARLMLHEAADDLSEALYVVENIQQMASSQQAKLSDYAVMYRTNAQSRLLEESFLRAGLPYRLVGAQRFYGRREVKDVIAYLRAVQNPADEVSLPRVINVPPRGIGEKTVAALQSAGRQTGLGAGGLLLELAARGAEAPGASEFSGRVLASLANFGTLLARWRGLRAEQNLPALFDQVIADSGYEAYLRDGSEEGEDRWENVLELRRLAFDYQERGLSEFLENLALVSDQDTVPEQADAPTLLTLHAAKGLEFPRVFIIGLDEGLLPHSRSRDDPEEMAEERRLFYVGLTRAKDQVVLVRANRRSTYGSYETSEASRFLEDIPDRLLQRSGVGQSFSRGSLETSLRSWDSPARSSYGNPAPRSAPVAPPAGPRYKTNQRVLHPAWGEGLVTQSRMGDDGEETVDVFFESVGFKRLLASLAKLEVVS